MTEQIRNQKDTLAKLMATENLTVVHKKIPTAYFDVKNRVLACPVLKNDISPELYDLFMGHEVGHALHTPLEGLHSTLTENKTLKGYLNVIEDVRIESAIKNKFTGLRKSFFKAYNELMDMDFFKLNGRKLQSLSLIDKINLITKVGSRVNITLTDEEQVFLDMAYACKTWDDVVACSQAIYDWSKENETRDEEDQKIVPTSYQYDESDFDEDEDDYDDMSEMFGEDEEEGEDTETTSGGSDLTDTLPDLDTSEMNDTGETVETEEEPKDEIKNTGEKRDGGTSANQYDDEDGAREALTEHYAHENEELFISDDATVRTQLLMKDVYEKINADSCVISHKQILSDWKKFWAASNPARYEMSEEELAVGLARAKLTAKRIQNKNKKVVMHMAKEFEMRQTAMRSVKAFQGKTGKLDMNSLAKYQIVEDVFKRATYLPEGKNHGITVLLDWSGSIQREAADLLEQSIILAEFCRKTGIPYRVYLFSDSYFKKSEFESSEWGSRVVSLLEVMSNEMSNRQHQEMMINIASLWNNFWLSTFSHRKNYAKIIETYNDMFGEVDYMNPETTRGYLYFPHYCRPSGYDLGGTPLNSALVALRKLLPKFNKKYAIEKSILTVVTDGYSHDCDALAPSRKESEEYAEQRDDIYTGWTRELIDHENNKPYEYSKKSQYRNGFDVTQNLLSWIEDTTGVQIAGYFVLGKKGDLYHLLQMAGIKIGFDTENLWKDVRTNGAVVKCKGYNKLFITTPKSLGVDTEDTLSDDFIDAKKVRVLAAFKRNQKAKTTSRFLTNEFIKEIA